MRAIDANVLVRLLARDRQEQAALADAFVAPGAWVSHLVLVEAVWVLESVYEHRPAQIADALELLLEHESLILQDADIVAAALAQLHRKACLGFSDCLILEVARKAGHVPLGIFDRQLARLDGAEKL